MSFSGELAHLPIVDVIQLIHTTKKSGTLTVEGQKGRSQLVFSDGYFVSANHLNNSVRIGQILIDMGLLSIESLEAALQEQRAAGATRKPLVATLIEQGLIKPEDAYRGLESLIEMTIVEVLTWPGGRFSLDVSQNEVSDEYRYFPETLKQEMLMNAQGILMDALRIYDEKMRDGTLENIFFPVEEEAEPEPATGGDMVVTADLLGLDALETIDKKIPSVFSGLRDDDLSREHRQAIADGLGHLTEKAQEQLCSFLRQVSSSTPPEASAASQGKLPLAVIVLSHDPFIKHAITTICRSKGYIVFTTDDSASLDLIIEQSFSRDLLPVLIVDDPRFVGDGLTVDVVAAMLQEKRDKYPRISILQMSTAPEDQTFPSHVLDEGTDAVFPRPVPGECPDTFVAHMTSFLQTFCAVLDKSFVQTDRKANRRLKECVATLSGLTEPPEVAREILLFASGLFERAMILVVGTTDLTAEKGIGVNAAKEAGLTGPLMYKIPRGQRSVFDSAIEKKQLYYGICSEPFLARHLYAEIPAPRSPKVLLLPIVLSGNVIALIYADFGQLAPSPVPVEHLEVLAAYARVLLDYSFYRKKLERLAQPR